MTDQLLPQEIEHEYPRPTRYWKAGDKPPQFEARSSPHSDGDKQWMQEWVCSRLHDIWQSDLGGNVREDDIWFNQANAGYAAIREAKFEWAAVEAAEHGDLGPLKAMFPGHARFINVPTLAMPRDRWKRRHPISFSDLGVRLKLAISEMSLIRDIIWPNSYRRKNSPKSGPSAEKIVADRWGLEEEEINKRRLARWRRIPSGPVTNWNE